MPNYYLSLVYVGKASTHIVILSICDFFGRIFLPEFLLNILQESKGNLILETSCRHANKKQIPVLEYVKIVSRYAGPYSPL